jgi:hypothetical protein
MIDAPETYRLERFTYGNETPLPEDPFLPITEEGGNQNGTIGNHNIQFLEQD